MLAPEAALLAELSVLALAVPAELRPSAPAPEALLAQPSVLAPEALLAQPSVLALAVHAELQPSAPAPGALLAQPYVPAEAVETLLLAEPAALALEAEPDPEQAVLQRHRSAPDFPPAENSRPPGSGPSHLHSSLAQ